MRWHQNNIFKDNIAIWKRFIRTDYMTTGLIDVDAEMVQPNRLWLMVEDKNFRKKQSDKGDAFQIQIMQERADASKLPFIGIFSENRNEQSPYIYLQQSTVYNIVTNVKTPNNYKNLPIDIVFYKWLKENNLFLDAEEELTFIKTYNNNVLRFAKSVDLQRLQQPTFETSVDNMINNWGINNKVWTNRDIENGFIDQLAAIIKDDIRNYCSNVLDREDLLVQNTNTPTYEQNTGTQSDFYFITKTGDVVVRNINEIKTK